jgi:DNA repair exonuclease SbcCD ATPase subunit
MNPSLFEIYVRGELLDQDAKMKDYQERLEKNILKINYKSFTQIIVLGSSTFLPFMKLNPAHRREVIEDLLEIEVFSLMNNLLRVRMAENHSLLSENNIASTLVQEKISLQEKYIREVEEIKNDKIVETESSLEENRKKLVANESEAYPDPLKDPLP